MAGRPTLYDPRYCDEMVAFMALGGSMTAYAAEIDVCRDTISEWVKKHPDFAHAAKRGKAKCAAWWEKRARVIAETGGGPGSGTMTVFGLKNMAPDDWKDSQQIDHSSTDGSMTPKEPTYKLVK